ncbi:cytochrome P450 [Streptomyces sp. NPDC127072]|uniref:cytochrome P450 n=1 Tax=Streptomyces sp. NPDC127072 TaxID=3347129 RepID=UPI003665A136
MSESAIDQLPPVLKGFDLTDHARFATIDEGFPYELFSRLRREAPVLFHPPGQTADQEGFWVVSRHADIAAVASDPDTFSARGGGGRSGGGSAIDDIPDGDRAGAMVAMQDNPRHHLLKHLLAPAVANRVADVLEADLRANATRLVDQALAGGGACDFANDITEPYAYRSMAVLLGVPDEDQAKLADWAHRSVGFIDRRTGLSTETSRETILATQEYVRELIERKRVAPEEDLASVLAAGELPAEALAEGEPPLSDHERFANILLLLLTGAEQPRNTIARGVLALAHQPEQWRALREDRGLIPSAIEELLRFAPPNQYNRRTATVDARVGDTEIRAGQKVSLWWPSGNRDEEVFDDPSRFDIRRTSNPHLSFGHGNHYCLGSDVARLQIRLLLEELLDSVAEIRLAGKVTYQPWNKHTIVLDMPVELIPAGA